MKNSMKLSAAMSIAVLAGCGGSVGNAALSKAFTYGAPATPTTQETAAATSAQSQLSGTASFGSAPGATSGAAIIAFADSLAASALGSSGVPMAVAPSGSGSARALTNADVYSTCTTTTASSVTFNNCQIVSSGYTVTISGTISVSANTVSWNISGGVSGTDAATGIAVNVSHRQSGSLTVTATKVTGDAVSSISGSVSAQGQTVNFGVDSAVLVDLTYQGSPFCVTAGSVEVKRVWTQKPNGASGPAYNDAAVKLTWTGCNAPVQVAHSQ
jgi:hypothetical protein